MGLHTYCAGVDTHDAPIALHGPRLLEAHGGAPSFTTLAYGSRSVERRVHGMPACACSSPRRACLLLPSVCNLGRHHRAPGLAPGRAPEIPHARGLVFRLVSCDLMGHTHRRAAAAGVVSCAVS